MDDPVLYALAAGVIPSFIWLFFWTREDHEQPEPRTLLAACFVGGMVAVIIAIPIVQWIAGLTNNPRNLYIFWAVTEEVLKLSVVAIVAMYTRFNDQPIDGMIYFITVALGFAALENTLFILKTLNLSGDVIIGVTQGNLRFIGATLVHVVSSALIGFGLGLTFYRGRLAKFAGWFLGLAAAITLHTLFNIMVSNTDPLEKLKAFGLIWGAVIILIVLFEEVKTIRPRPAH